MKKHKCWTCAHAGYCHKPISGWDATFHHNNYDNHDTWTVHECPKYEYDGECVSCIRNIYKEQRCKYNDCPFFIKGKRGRCAQENWKRQWEKENGMPFVEVEEEQRPSKQTRKSIRCVETGKVYPSIKAATEAVNGNHGNISACCRNPNYTSCGYHWEYA